MGVRKNIGVILDSKFNGHWVMIDNSYARFNLWRYKIDNGESYIESFPKNVDPNVISEVKERKLTYGEKMNYAKELFRQGKSIMDVNDIIDTGLGPLSAAYNVVLEEKGHDKDYKKIGRPNKYG